MTVASSLNNIAGVLQEQGQLAEAQSMYQQALETYRNIGNERSAAGTLSNMGAVYQLQGDLLSANKMYQQALDELPYARRRAQSGDRVEQYRGGSIPSGRSGGRAQDARQALAISKESGDPMTVAEALFDLGQVLAAQGDLAGARGRHEEALKTRLDAGQTGPAAESRLALAQLSLDDGRSADAEEPARQAAEEFHKQDAPDLQALAQEVLARSLLLQGKLAEAGKVIAGASTLAGKVRIGTCAYR